MRRGKGMMRRRPAPAVGIPLEHGEIRHPQMAIAVGIFAAAGESLMTLGVLARQLHPQLPGSVIDSMIVLLDLGLHASLGFVFRRLQPAGDNDDQIMLVWHSRPRL